MDVLVSLCYNKFWIECAQWYDMRHALAQKLQLPFVLPWNQDTVGEFLQILDWSKGIRLCFFLRRPFVYGGRQYLCKGNVLTYGARMQPNEYRLHEILNKHLVVVLFHSVFGRARR